ncbi:MAG: DEAD/DEAH box helicase [Spirochaetales bacterium]|nr:DEAD/DEAH box helicase [Spirochaetales bacterium]
MDSFRSIGAREEFASALVSFGFEKPTEIQDLALPALAAGRDAFITAPTGTGKTFAYLIPVLTRMLELPGEAVDASPRVLILAPTHELAVQLQGELEKLSEASGLGFRSVLAIGSTPMFRQIERLRAGPAVVVGTAGRVRDLVESGEIKTGELVELVLDEADRLFSNEYLEATEAILGAIPQACRRILVSATLADRIVAKAGPWFLDPERVTVDPSKALRESIEHWVFHSPSRRKIDFIRRFEAALKPERALVFAASNAAIFNIARKLKELGLPFAELRATGDKVERRRAIDDFREGRIRWLLTTDLGARGLDVADIDFVLSMDIPEDHEIYVHRAGRTGRAGAKGISVAVADLFELKRASRIAVRYGFAFKCKFLEAGAPHDIDPENFFALAEEEEVERKVKPPLEAKRFTDDRSARFRRRDRGPELPEGLSDFIASERRSEGRSDLSRRRSSGGNEQQGDAQRRHRFDDRNRQKDFQHPPRAERPVRAERPARPDQSPRVEEGAMKPRPGAVEGQEGVSRRKRKRRRTKGDQEGTSQSPEFRFVDAKDRPVDTADPAARPPEGEQGEARKRRRRRKPRTEGSPGAETAD